MILWGLFKKMVVADRAGIFVDAVFHDSAAYTGLPVMLAVLLYTIQIYADFSGVMDIVRGVARLFGIQMALNFRRPFFSTSVQEFWRRWHITLGAWLRDYVFYPVSLSKPILALGKKAKKVFKGHAGRQLPAICALFFVWFGNGLWHGAGWKFIAYGLYYYIIMTIGTLFETVRNVAHCASYRPGGETVACLSGASHLRICLHRHVDFPRAGVTVCGQDFCFHVPGAVFGRRLGFAEV